jgi:mannose-6-phosphate isomerase-like protein (cupin superfamily)
MSANTVASGRDNLHRGADQWLLVVEGTGIAVVNGHKTRLMPGTIVLIEAGEYRTLASEDGQRLCAAGLS